MYLKKFYFPTSNAEGRFLYPNEKTPVEIINNVYKDYRARFYAGSTYPFNILADKLHSVAFDKITIFSGGNGSGKTTALNVIAEKLKVKRDNLFNTGRFFQDYLNMCECSVTLPSEEDAMARRRKEEEEGIFLPQDSCIIVSDDVFAFSMKQRYKNDTVLNGDLRKAEEEYKRLAESNPNLQSLADYERWKERSEALKNKSAFMKKHLQEIPEYSNGETAMLYFINRMENPGLYLLDEPENSLSFENQLKLAEYISLSARFFNYQFIIATHSPAFLSLEKARIYNLDAYPAQITNWTEISGIREMYQFFRTHESKFEK